MIDSDSALVATHCEKHLDLDSLELGEEYFYQSLPLCVVDSVFSIGVKFKGVQNTVRHCCDYLRIEAFRAYRAEHLPESNQISIEGFLSRLEGLSGTQLADEVFGNRQRTSPRSGTLKADAVERFARVLRKQEINYFSDIEAMLEDEKRLKTFEENVQKIPGQKSGISTTYFFMLAGSNNLIKPDRQILKFLENALDRPAKSIGLKEAQNLVSGAVKQLKSTHPDLNARLLDYGIWSFQRLQKGGPK